MRSSDLAQLAGVTVRTLRHYHAIGLLPEPPRHPNGYREYGAEHLARVLRIKQLASLGFPLDRIGGMLDDLDAGPLAETGAFDALDELDAALQAEIERIEEQRRTIAHIRQDRIAIDMPARSAPMMEAMRRVMREAGYGSGADGEDAMDRTSLLLLSHMYEDEELAEAERLFTAISEFGFSERLVAVGTRSDELAPDASEEERAAVVDEGLDLMRELVECLDPGNWLRDYTSYELLMESYARESLNPAQIDVMDRIERGIEDLVRQRVKDDPPAGT